MNDIWMPSGAKYIIRILNMFGFKGYVVGGCVRDSLLGATPHDWDLCTDAKPVEIVKCFQDHKVIETGIKHGTVTIVLPDGNYEVTTFRIDGEYSDHRRPDQVTFTDDLETDLSRRDFKMNAMAYGVDGLVDPFGGVGDLRNEVISCVGNPDDRFREDALRIMRALRFASDYGYQIEEQTAKAIHRNKDLLNNIAVERIQSELCKLLMGRRACSILMEFSDVITTIIPELAPCVGFKQNNPYHEYTVYDHIAHAVGNYRGDDISIKVALLLHDIGKPQCYTEDEKGGHFHGHSVPSHDLAEQVMRRLRFDNDTTNEVLDLVLYHDSVIEPTPKTVRRWLNKIGTKRFMQLMDVRMADILAHTKGTQESRIDRRNALCAIMEEVVKEKQCFTLKDLGVNGYDLINAFAMQEGKQIGEVLNYLLNEVINGNIQNDVHMLLDEAENI